VRLAYLFIMGGRCELTKMMARVRVAHGCNVVKVDRAYGY